MGKYKEEMILKVNTERQEHLPVYVGQLLCQESNEMCFYL